MRRMRSAIALTTTSFSAASRAATSPNGCSGSAGCFSRRSTGRTKSDRFVYPHVLRYVQHAEFGCHSLIPGTTLDELTAGFDEARRAGGDFCLATHYWEVDDAMKQVLLRFLDHASRHADVQFVAAEDLFA